MHPQPWSCKNNEEGGGVIKGGQWNNKEAIRAFQGPWGAPRTSGRAGRKAEIRRACQKPMTLAEKTKVGRRGCFSPDDIQVLPRGAITMMHSWGGGALREAASS